MTRHSGHFIIESARLDQFYFRPILLKYYLASLLFSRQIYSGSASLSPYTSITLEIQNLILPYNTTMRLNLVPRQRTAADLRCTRHIALANHAVDQSTAWATRQQNTSFLNLKFKSRLLDEVHAIYVAIPSE